MESKVGWPKNLNICFNENDLEEKEIFMKEQEERSARVVPLKGETFMI